MPSAERHWPPAGKAVGGEPRVRRPAARRADHRTPRGRRIRVQALPRTPRGTRGRSLAGSGSPAAAPQRIISLSPTATESLFAIGAGRQVVAVDDQSDYPKQAPHTALSGFTPNIEAIAGYKPDLVVVSYDPNGLVATLRGLGIRVLVQDAATNLDEAYAQIQQLGALTGHAKQAAALVARMKERIAELVAAGTRRARGLTVYHELEPDLYSVTSSTFIGRVYALFGLKNIADAADAGGTGYPKLSAEYVVSQSPDIVVLADIALLRAVAADGRGAAGLGQPRSRADGHDRPGRRLDRLALGPADRRLRPRGRGGARARPA